MCGAAGADYTEDMDEEDYFATINKVNEIAVIVGVDSTIPLPPAAWAGLQFRAERYHATVKVIFSGGFSRNKLAINQVLSYHHFVEPFIFRTLILC